MRLLPVDTKPLAIITCETTGGAELVTSSFIAVVAVYAHAAVYVCTAERCKGATVKKLGATGF